MIWLMNNILTIYLLNSIATIKSYIHSIQIYNLLKTDYVNIWCYNADK